MIRLLKNIAKINNKLKKSNYIPLTRFMKNVKIFSKQKQYHITNWLIY